VGAMRASQSDMMSKSLDSNAAISLASVSKAYNGLAAISDVTVAVARGEFVVIVGGSGAGKTTVLKLINRLLEADSGAIAVFGQSTREIEAHALRRQIGYVFQGIGLFPHLTIAENIGITLELLGRDRREIEARVEELLTLVDLPKDFRERFPAELSGGQRQRVGIARALAAKPNIMLMDEPFGALDPVTRDALSTEYRRLHDSLGLTTVMVTHDAFEAVLMADRIVVMHEGKIIADDSPRALLNRATHPQVRRLMEMPHRQAARVESLVNGKKA
jgi:osmoprotectant transport system ATP-binding protein